MINYGPLVELEIKKLTCVRTLSHKLLQSISVELDRHTGSNIIMDKTFGSFASITIVGEVKNYVADPDDVLKMWKTDFQNLSKFAILGDVKLNHQMNSVLATKMIHFKMGDVVNDTLTECQNIANQLEELIGGFYERLSEHKKSSVVKNQR